jgi:predicted MPP superfamily phosphohydrolase
MIEITLKNKKVLTISDLHIESVHDRILAYSPEIVDELYNIE